MNDIVHELAIGALLGLGAVIATGAAVLFWTAEDFYEEGEDDE